MTKTILNPDDTIAPTGALIGYARVSTKKQTLDQQIDALVKFGVDPEMIFTDKMSGTREDRPGLKEMMRIIRKGDTVVVWRLDRLGRSLSHVVRTAEEIHKKGAELRGLSDGLDYSTMTGRLMAAILAALAEYERELIAERAEAAREAARARGKQTGRPRAIDADKLESIVAMRAAGQAMPAICRTLNVAKSTAYRMLAEAGTTNGAQL